MLNNKEKEIFDSIVPIAEVPKYISFSVKTLRNWRAGGIYPHIFVKLGGKVFVNMREFAQIAVKQNEKAIQDAKRLGLYE